MDNDTVAHTKTSLYDLFYSTKEKRTYTNLGVSLVLIIVFLTFALVPTLTTLDTIQDSIKEYTQLNKGLKQKVEAIRSLTSQRNNDAKDEVDFLQKTFTSNLEINSLYINIYRRAKDTNVKIITLNPKYPTSGTNVSGDTVANLPSEYAYEVQINATADKVSDISSFINTLESAENMPIPMRVKTISVVDLAQSSKSQSRVNTTVPQNATGYTIDLTLLIYLDSAIYQPEL